MKRRTSPITWLAAGAVLALSGPGLAGEVTLKAHDGSMELKGEFIDFDGQNYTIRSAIGEMSVDGARVECLGSDCPVIPEALLGFSVAGSKTAGAVLVPRLVEAFALDIGAETVLNAGAADALSLTLRQDEAEATVSVRLGGSASGASELAEGTADIAILSRPATPEELAPLGPGAAPVILALDALVPVVSDDHFLRSISEQDLASIYSGGVVTWADLGGPDRPIRMYLREALSGTREAFDQIVMDAFIAELADEVTVLETDEAIADAVAADPDAIGIVSLAAVRNARVLPLLGICGIETRATPFTVKTEEYPLSRRIFAIARDGAPETAGAFLGFAAGPDAQFDIADAGYTDQRIESWPVGAQGDRFATALMPGLSDVSLDELQSMMADLVLADRLSVTFRFDKDSGAPDARALADLARLAAYLAAPEWQGREVILAGFMDSEAEAAANRETSLARATAFRDALLAAAPAGALDGVTITAKGYGEASPLACNDIASGRAVNRRVEVWVK